MDKYGEISAHLALIGVCVTAIIAISLSNWSIFVKYELDVVSVGASFLFWIIVFPHDWIKKTPKIAVAGISQEQIQKSRAEAQREEEAQQKQIMDKWITETTDIYSKLDKNIKSRKNPQLELILLNEFRVSLGNLPYPRVVPWTQGTRKLLNQTLDLIYLLLTEFFDYEERCLDWITIIWIRNDGQSRQLIKSKFLDRITLLIKYVRLKENKDVLFLYQNLNEFQTEPMKELIEEALSTSQEPRFNIIIQHLDLQQLKSKNPEGFKIIFEYLWQEMESSENSYNFERFRRAKILYDRMKMIQ